MKPKMGIMIDYLQSLEKKKQKAIECYERRKQFEENRKEKEMEK